MIILVKDFKSSTTGYFLWADPYNKNFVTKEHINSILASIWRNKNV